MKTFKGMFKLPKYRQFDYEPRYYDPIKERIEERTKELKAQMKGEYSADALRERIRFTHTRSRSQNRSTILLRLAIVVGLCILFYVLFKF